MSSSIPFKQYIGPTLIAQTLDSHGYRPYLQRNLRQILKEHETELNFLKAKQAGQPLLVSATRKEHRKAFQMPDREKMATSVQQSKPPCLKIQFRAFQRANVDYTSDEEVVLPDPAWLPNPGKFPVTCYVQAPTSAESQQLLVDECRLGSLTRKRDKNGQTRFTFDLDEPVYIDLKTMTGAKTIKFRVKFDHVEDAKEFDREISRGRQSWLEPPSELRATWKDTGKCPSEERLIKSSVVRNDVQQLLSGWGFLIEMNWSERCASALEIFNQTLSEGMYPQTLEASTDTEAFEKQQQYRITYIFTGNALQSRSIVYHNLSCIYCDSRYPHSTFDNLHMHYLGHHDHFKFTVTYKRERAEKVREMTVHINYAEPQLERASHVLESKVINWVRPDEPFDANSYLYEDDQSWISHRSVKGLALDGSRPLRRLKLNGPRLGGLQASSPELLNYDKLDRATRPEHVADLPMKRRRTYKVPEIPDVIVFRTNSKRAVQTGEWLTESDAENEDDWLDLRKTLSSGSTARLQFEPLYEAHMKEEEPLANIYFRHTIIRFCRKHADRLPQPSFLAALETKLAELVAYRKITERTKSDCLEMLQKKQHEEEVMTGPDHHGAADMNNSSQRVGTGSEASVLWKSSSATVGVGRNTCMGPPPTTGLHQHPSTRNPLCVCGKPCTTARGIIYCSNLSCLRNDFHLQCVGLAKRVPGWRCPDCRAVTSALVAPMAVM